MLQIMSQNIEKNEFLLMKIISAAYKIKNNKQFTLKLGSLDYCRDWSYAEDIAEGFDVVNYRRI